MIRYIRILNNLSFQSDYLLYQFRLFYGIITHSDLTNSEVHVGKWDVDFKIEFLRFWMYVLPLRQKLGLEVYAEEAWKPTLHILTFIGESVAYSSNHLINFFIQLWFIPFHFSNSYDYCKIVEENFNVVVQERALMVFPKSMGKHSLEFSRFFSFLYQFIDSKKKTR